VLEAMACGTVPVCSNEGGASSLITNNQNGIICKAKDSFDFSKKILSLINNQYELNRISENCIEYASKQSWGNIFSMQYQHYLDIIRQHSFKGIVWDSNKAINYLSHTMN
jgi:glycosyltransferase involved in cell wall biosynthesis